MSDTPTSKQSFTSSVDGQEEHKKKVIQTSALSELKLDDKTSKEEEVAEALPQIHSLLGHQVQGDSYRNDLDLAFDRVIHDADAPEYQAPQEPEVEQQKTMEVLGGAFEPFSFDELDDLQTSDHTSKNTPTPVSSDSSTSSSATPTPNTKTTILGEFSIGALENLRDQAQQTPQVQSGKSEQDQEDEMIMDAFERLGSIPDPTEEDSVDPSDDLFAQETVVPSSISTDALPAEDTLQEELNPSNSTFDADTWGESLGEMSVDHQSVEIEYTPISDSSSKPSPREVNKAPNDPFAQPSRSPISKKRPKSWLEDD